MSGSDGSNGSGNGTPGGAGPPHNLDAERSVLGAVLLSDTALPALIIDERLQPEDFYREAHRIVFKAMLDIHGAGRNVDELTLAEHLKQSGELERIGGPGTIDLLAASVPAVANHRDYARIVRENAMLRRLLGATYEIQERVHRYEAPPRELVDLAERSILEVAHDDRRKDFRAIHDLLDAELDKLHALSREGKAITGTASGFDDLDRITGGFQPGNLVILAARPSMGKSALMANFAENAALTDGKAVALFSLEMSESELAQRFIASQASIKGDDLRKGSVPETRWPKIIAASERLAASPLFVDDSSDLSVLDVRAKARRLTQQHADGLGLILIDYLQLMRAAGGTDSRVEQIGQISRGLKTLARELDVPVVALSQLNRGVEQRTDKRPVLSDLRESGCLAGDTLVTLVTGERVAISNLGHRLGEQVWALDRRSWRLEPRPIVNAFCTGEKPILRMTLRSGRRIRATANHRFLTLAGWRRLDALGPGARIATPRELNVRGESTLTHDELALLGHLIGDGCTLPRQPIHYTTNDEAVAHHVAALATRVFGARVRPRVQKERTWFVPREAWDLLVRPAMATTGVMARQLQGATGMSDCGSTLYRTSMSRARAHREATIVRDPDLQRLAASDVYWDEVVAVEPDGHEPVFDLTIDGLHNFVAEDIVVHNSIEQDADLVMFIYREEYYDRDSEREGIADLIVAKHRNGGLGTVELTFQKDYPRFMSYVSEDRY